MQRYQPDDLFLLSPEQPSRFLFFVVILHRHTPAMTPDLSISVSNIIGRFLLFFRPFLVPHFPYFFHNFMFYLPPLDRNGAPPLTFTNVQSGTVSQIRFEMAHHRANVPRFILRHLQRNKIGNKRRSILLDCPTVAKERLSFYGLSVANFYRIVVHHPQWDGVHVTSYGYSFDKVCSSRQRHLLQMRNLKIFFWRAIRLTQS